MDRVRAALSFLNDPKLVAKFQAACGLEIGFKDSGLNSMDEEDGHSDGNTSDNENNEDDEDADQEESDAERDSGTDDSPEPCQPPQTVEIAVASPKSSNGGGATAVTATTSRSRRRRQKQLRCSEDEQWKQSVKSRVQNSLMDYSMKNNVDYKIHNLFLYHLFSFGAMLGNEEFNCTFFPYWFWNVDGYVCRRVVIAWGFSMWFGQAMKDVIRSPRPASPPVAKLEKRYELEYGFPSTHATIAITIPFSLFFLTKDRYLFSTELGFILCAFWCILVCLSRVYLGMHSVLDVLSGALYGVVFLTLIYPYLDAVDNFQMTHPYAPFLIPVCLLLLCTAYPKLDQWNSARGDSTMTLAVMCGVSVASWLAYQQGFYDRPLEPPPYAVKFPDIEFIGSTVMRMALGGTVLIATRSAMKSITYHCLCLIHGLDASQNQKNLQLLKVELPYKFITYSLVAFNVVYTCPILFRLIGIERIIAFTDLNPV